MNGSLRQAALLACLLGLSFFAAAWGFLRFSRSPAGSGRVYRIQVVENNLCPHVSRVLLLPKGKLLVLNPGQSERWRCLVELSGGSIVGDPKRLKCLRKGSPAWVLQGLGPEASVPVADFGLARVPLALEATGYDPGPVDNTRGWVGITKSGERARFGIAAVDPRVIPLGAHLYVEGYGPALAADVGGAIKGHKIDLCFNSTRQANTWGRRKKTRVWRIDALHGVARARWQDRLSPTAQGPLGGPSKLR